MSVSNVPLNSVAGTGANAPRFEADSAAHGALGYCFEAQSAIQQNARFNITSDLIQSIRFPFRFRVIPTVTRACFAFRHSAGNAQRFRVIASAGRRSSTSLTAHPPIR